ncbi:MAG: PHP domain-containing protein [Desulfobacteraceae bacterium]|nr:PHP domain-containing protein [Desulfobacteraceae bacterium]
MKKPLDSNLHGGIDLHIHSTASDGTFTPSELISMAAQLGLQAIAITDHDTLEGGRQAQNCAIPDHLRLLSGVEISAAPPEGFSMSGSLHILGYGIDLNFVPLQQALADLQHARDMRIPRIVELLNRLGIDITMPEVLEQVGQGSAGRPHVARVLINKGVATDVNDAFDRFLAKGQPAYVDKYRIPCRRALDLIHMAKGVSVLAHPYLVPGGSSQLHMLVKTLKGMGLMGIEAFYPHHTPEGVKLYTDLARQFNLLVTGGTDFHGTLTPDIRMGSGRGDLKVPFSVYETLVAHLPNPKQ